MYKVEFFDRDMEYQSAHFFEIDEVCFDYLTLDTTTITVAKTCKAHKGSIAHITGDIYFDGIVSDIQPSDGTVAISIRPLQSLFDFEVFVSEIEDVADFLYTNIKNELIENTDVLQNRPIKISNITQFKSRPLVINTNKVNLIEIIAAALTSFQIAVDCNLNMKEKKIVTIIKNVIEEKTLEADLCNVLYKEFTLGDSYGSFNKAVFRKTLTDKDTGDLEVLDTSIFFLHTTGNVSSVNTDRIVPVFFTIEDIETSDNWNEDAKARAMEILNPQNFDNEIILTYSKYDKICNPILMQIGTVVSIYLNKKMYKSMLTGKMYSANTVKLIFGILRVDLTKKLILERRK